MGVMMTKCASGGLPNYSPPKVGPVSQATPAPTPLEVESGDGETEDMSEDIDEAEVDIIQEEDVLREDEEEIAFLDF